MISNIYIRYLAFWAFIWVMLLGLSSCADEAVDYPDSPEIVGETFNITGSLIIPDMPEMMTRGTLGDRPNDGLKLTILEFDLASTAEQSFITNVYHAELKSNTGVANGGTVTFNVTLNAATTGKILHLMIANDYISVPSEGGSIASLLPTLSVGSESGGQPEAYWGYVEFKDGFSTTTTDPETGITTPVLRDEVKTKLTNVPVIRNFAKITVTKDASLTNFSLTGFDVVSCPTSGTIAPYNAPLQRVPDLLSTSNTMLSYSDIAALPYSGILPANVGFRNQEDDAKNWKDGPNENMRSLSARYLYEHPYEPSRRTYVIINATYNGQQGFYKIDIGNLNADGTFNYYNIIRNINYNIRITEVLAPGAATVAEAIARAPFNNLLAATETSSSLNVSDGVNMLVVNDVNHVVVNSGGEVKILYRYITDVTGEDKVANDVPHYIVGAGDVIKKNVAGDYEITQGVYTDKNTKAEWVELTVQINDPDEYETKEQTVTIVDGNGLGRTITIVLRRPWEFRPIGTNTATVATGSSNLYGANVPTTPEKISNAAGADFTLYFNLPDGIPDSVFPLDFTIESRYQGLENNKIGTMLVTSGSSLFDKNVTAIQYIKTVTLNEYKYQYRGESDSSGFDTGKPNTNHTIRCRFTTISAVSNNSSAEIKVNNEYFKDDADVKFTRGS